MVKAYELREKNQTELENELQALKEELFKLRFQQRRINLPIPWS